MHSVATHEEIIHVRHNDRKRIHGEDSLGMRRGREDLSPEPSFEMRTGEHKPESIQPEPHVGNGTS
jgi:hypothetical protein